MVNPGRCEQSWDAPAIHCARCVQRLVTPIQAAGITPSIRGHRRMFAGRHNTYNIPAATRAPGFAARQPKSQRRAAVPRCAPPLSALSPLMHAPSWSPGPAKQTLSNSNVLCHAGELPAPVCHMRASMNGRLCFSPERGDKMSLSIEKRPSPSAIHWHCATLGIGSWPSG